MEAYILMRGYYDYDGDPYAYCSECGAKCLGVARDYGVGAFECRGERGVDSDIHIVSPCCEADLVEWIDEVDPDRAALGGMAARLWRLLFKLFGRMSDD